MLRFWNVLVLVLNFESIFCDLLASVSLVNKNGCKGLKALRLRRFKILTKNVLKSVLNNITSGKFHGIN